MLDHIDVDSLIMESIRNDEPASATTEELEALIDGRQRTLTEWYERRLIDTSTFGEESRRKIREVMDQSEDVYGSEADIRQFFERGRSKRPETICSASSYPRRFGARVTVNRTGRSRSTARSRWTTTASSTSHPMRTSSRS